MLGEVKDLAGLPVPITTLVLSECTAPLHDEHLAGLLLSGKVLFGQGKCFKESSER